MNDKPEKTVSYVELATATVWDARSGEIRPFKFPELQFFDPNHVYEFGPPSTGDYARWSGLSY